MKYLKLYESFILESKEETKGILYPLSDGGKKTLVLLPGSGQNGGQGDADFQKLAEDLGKDFSVYTADFPNEFNVRNYANKIAKEIEANDDIKTCAVGGFSIGGAIAWHLAGALGGSKKFNKQLFFIDSGIPDSTEEFAIGIVKGNTPRVAMATPMRLIKKARSGGDFTKKEIESVKHLYSKSELDDFKSTNKGNYIEYFGEGNFPPADEEKLDAAAKSINKKMPYIIEDKYDKTEFGVRYSVKPPAVEGMAFEEGDVFNNIRFVEQDTLKKLGLGRELSPIKISKLKMNGPKKTGQGRLPELEGVGVISLVAGNKEGKPKQESDYLAQKIEAEGATSGEAKTIVIGGVEHKDITKSLDLATEIANNFN
jgi:hypothetical protein